MKRCRFVAVAAFLCSMPHVAVARDAVGAYGNWAVFADDDPRRCYALSAPRVPGGQASLAIGIWPDKRVGPQVHVRLARPARAGSAILLQIDDRVFPLRGGGTDAWAPDHAADRAIVTAMRTGVRLAVTTRDARGGSYVDAYALSGAATAIDAAAIACRRR